MVYIMCLRCYNKQDHSQMYYSYSQYYYENTFLITFYDVSKNRSNVYYWVKLRKRILDIDFNVKSRNEPGRLTFSRFGMSKYYQLYSLWFYSQVLLHLNYKKQPFSNQWILDLEDLHSIISIHFIHTSHYYCCWFWSK